MHAHYAAEKRTYAREVARRDKLNAAERATIQRDHASFITGIEKARQTESAEALAQAATQAAQATQAANAATQQSQASLLSQLEASIKKHQNDLAVSDQFVQPVSSVTCIPTTVITVNTQTAAFNCIAIWSNGDGTSGTPYTATLDYDTGAWQWQES